MATRVRHRGEATIIDLATFRANRVSAQPPQPTKAERAATPECISWDYNDRPIHRTDCPHHCEYVGSCVRDDCPIWRGK